jgi:RHS repeat-associated protein
MGNLIADDGRGRQFTYNAMGRMAEVRQGASVLRRYAYNAWGEQVSKTDGTEAGTTLTLYDEAGHWLGDYDHAGHATQQAVWLDDHPIGLLQAGHTYYLETDHLGTPRVAIDPARDVAAWRWDLKGEAFGSTAPDEDPDRDGTAFVLDMRFPGQRYDAVTGLYYNYFRDYDSATGSYGQSDPAGLIGGIATYAYVSNDPIQQIDPLGLWPSNLRVPSSHRPPPGAGGPWPKQDIDAWQAKRHANELANPSLNATPGAWPGTNIAGGRGDPRYTFMCIQGICPTVPMACVAGLPSFSTLDFYGGYPTASEFLNRYPGCTCTRVALGDQVTMGVPAHATADTLEILNAYFLILRNVRIIQNRR